LQEGQNNRFIAVFLIVGSRWRTIRHLDRQTGTEIVHRENDLGGALHGLTPADRSGAGFTHRESHLVQPLLVEVRSPSDRNGHQPGGADMPRRGWKPQLDSGHDRARLSRGYAGPLSGRLSEPRPAPLPALLPALLPVTDWSASAASASASEA
jgi:hypothetical protein